MTIRIKRSEGQAKVHACRFLGNLRAKALPLRQRRMKLRLAAKMQADFTGPACYLRCGLHIITHPQAKHGGVIHLEHGKAWRLFNGLRLQQALIKLDATRRLGDIEKKHVRLCNVIFLSTPTNRRNCQELSAAEPVMTNPTERPNTLPWPPMIYGGLAIAGMLLQSYMPLPWPLPAMGLLGTVMFLVGIATDIGTMALFIRRKANILPHKAATTLITDGPFRYSRNPIYVGNTLMLAGAGIAFSSLWLVLAALIAAVLVHYLAIRREERHLAAKFGNDWNEYAGRTPRWLLF